MFRYLWYIKNDTENLQYSEKIHSTIIYPAKNFRASESRSYHNSDIELFNWE